MACTDCGTCHTLDGAALAMHLTIVRTTHHDHNLIIIHHEVVQVYPQVCGHIEAMGSESQVWILRDLGCYHLNFVCIPKIWSMLLKSIPVLLDFYDQKNFWSNCVGQDALGWASTRSGIWKFPKPPRFPQCEICKFPRSPKLSYNAAAGSNDVAS